MGGEITSEVVKNESKMPFIVKREDFRLIPCFCVPKRASVCATCAPPTQVSKVP